MESQFDMYPTEKQLEGMTKLCIQTSDDVLRVAELASEAWNKHYGLVKQRGRTFTFITGGWSGNEDIISAMKENRVFWILCWHQSTSGGKHVFKIARIEKGASDE